MPWNQNDFTFNGAGSDYFQISFSGDTTDELRAQTGRNLRAEIAEALRRRGYHRVRDAREGEAAKGGAQAAVVLLHGQKVR
jgi:hypothetical protein